MERTPNVNGGSNKIHFEFARKNEVIKASDRKKRNLFLTFSDEIKLLRACETEDRRHLRALIIVAVDLCRKLARFCADSFSLLEECDPILPPNVFNWLADNWRPLFAIAEIAGG